MIHNKHTNERVAATATDQSGAGREGSAGGVFTKQTHFGKTNPFWQMWSPIGLTIDIGQATAACRGCDPADATMLPKRKDPS